MTTETGAASPNGETQSSNLLRVLRQDRGIYFLYGENRIFKAELAGRFRHSIKDPVELPTIGDYVSCSRESDSEMLRIQSVQTRVNALLRKTPISGGRRISQGQLTGGRTEAQVLAANVDTAFIVAAAGQDSNGRRLERYILMLQESRIPTVILLNKCDLHEDRGDSFRTKLQRALPQVDTIPLLSVSAKTGEGLEQMAPWLCAGQSVVFIGSSGAGKTSLLQSLGAPAGKTGANSDYKEKGRHTTSRRESFWLPNGCLVIDTPGIRELQLWSDSDSVDELFGDIAELASACHFRNCRHQAEAGCAIRAAIVSGELDQKRFIAWQKLRQESQVLATRQRQLRQGGRPKPAYIEDEY